MMRLNVMITDNLFWPWGFKVLGMLRLNLSDQHSYTSNFINFYPENRAISVNQIEGLPSSSNKKAVNMTLWAKIMFFD